MGYSWFVIINYWEPITNWAGDERFRIVLSSYFKGISGIIYVYDITDRSSFVAITNVFYKLAHDNGNYESTVLVGNKCDRESERQVSYEEGEKLAKQLNASFFETSALDGTNVTEVFMTLTEDSYNKVIDVELHRKTIATINSNGGDRLVVIHMKW